MRILLQLFLTCLTCSLPAQTPRLVVPIGQTNVITAVAFSPDGKYVLTGSLDYTAKLWDLSGREIQLFKGHSKEVNAVAFSPDGQYVLTGSGDHTAKLWDLNGREIQSFTGHNNWVNAVAFSPDGKYVLTGSRDNTAKLWDLTGREILTFTGHTYSVNAVVFSPDGKLLLTGSGDHTAKCWDLKGREIQVFNGHDKAVQSVAFSPDGKFVLTGSADHTAKCWDLSGHEIAVFKSHLEPVQSVAFSPNGQYVLTSSEDGTAKLWNLNGREIQTFKGHEKPVNAAVFSPDGKSILTGSQDNSAKLWNLSGHELQVFKSHTSWVNTVSFSPNGKYLLTGNRNKTAKRWDLTGREIQTFKGHNNWVNQLACSPDSKYVFTCSRDSTAKMWDQTGLEVQTFKGHAGSVTSLAIAPDGKYLLTGSSDQTAILWDLSGRAVQIFKGHTEPVTSVAFSPDGNSVLTGSEDGTAKLWNLSALEIHTFKGHAAAVNSVAFSPDGKSILTGSGDNTAKLWDLSGREIQTFKGRVFSVKSVAFSPDGKYVLAEIGDKTAKLWDLSGREIQTFKGHNNWINAVVFSPDGKYVLTGSGDKTAKLWETQSGKERASLVTIDSADWVVTTPGGLFDASPGAMRLMHFMVGLEAIELEQLKERYYEPGLLSKVMGYSDDPLREVEGFDSVALYPSVRLELDTQQRKLHIHLVPRTGGIGKVSLFINGKEVLEEANPVKVKGFEKMRDTAITIDLDQYIRYFLSDSLNTISIRAYNEAGWLKSAALQVGYLPVFHSKGASQSSGIMPIARTYRPDPALYVLSVGTAKFAIDQLNLKYSAKDSKDMARAIKQIGTQLFTRDSVFVQLLTTDTSNAAAQPSKANIKAAFETIKKHAKAEDVVIVYFSGHGTAYGEADKALFYYLTKDIGSFDLSDAGIRALRTISSEELTRWINDIPAQKQVLIIDACNSGKIVENLAGVQKGGNAPQIRALDRMKDRTGMFVLTGSAGDKVSYESAQFGQGLLTYSLLQGMRGAALKSDKRVDVMKLFQYARDQVPVLAKGINGIQTPMLSAPLGGGSFDIGITNDSVQIPIATVKPVFIRSNFLDENELNDGLGLTAALSDYFQYNMSSGPDGEIIFVNVAEYPDGYSIKGLYSINNGIVTLRARLFKGRLPVSEFQVKGPKNDLDGLVKAIINKISDIIK